MIQDPQLAEFCDVFHKLDKHCTNKLYKAYTDDIEFRDPLHRITGITALQQYFSALYENVTECRFTFHEGQRLGDDAFLVWTMSLKHPRLAGGKRIDVEGCSRLVFADDASGRVCRHRDYFDVGELLYEHLPLLGPTIRLIKRRAGD
ncbi:nuclear transport factor 2 family protein [Halomonas sp. I1]|uniref:nuclear transport factor 2 family protein n=1 Tax=Halomonas sp. I1 TaxID=393536 RepID=UPI0028DD81E8|nr:nuclear transport factor 2 family protein [Halomonas sp. I1]MDT8894811.1 nuclear transport factor 2 family protein [Halomonas sp. I1]